jgi:prepilin signal peptidase PulO-like enzyme (type II secretory pathway)
VAIVGPLPLAAPRTLDTHIHITIRFDSLFLFYYFIFPGGRDSYIAHPTPPIAHYCLLSVFILFFFFQDRV